MKDQVAQPLTPVNPTSLSAFAVYNNLIPGIKSYQDTNNPLVVKGKKNRKRKKGQNALENGAGTATPGLTNGSEQTSTKPKGKKKRNRGKKRKLMDSTGEDAIQNGTPGLKKSSSSPVKKSMTPVANSNSKSTSTPKVQLQDKKTPAKQALPKEVSTSNGPASGKKSAKSTSAEDKDLAKKIQAIKDAEMKGKKLPKLVPNPAALLKEKSTPNVVEDNFAIDVCKDPPVDLPLRKKKKVSENNFAIDVCKDTPVDLPLPKKKKVSENNFAIDVYTPLESLKKKKEANKPKDYQNLPTLESILSSSPIEDSVLHGKSAFEWLISPIPITTFFQKYWEKQPLHIKRSEQECAYYNWIITSAKLDDIMRSHNIKFTKNIDITRYVDGVRETQNPVGRAMPAVVWDFYANGSSVRFLNPQTYVKPLWRLSASLQEYIGTFVGANVYLTPPDTQGFAPHYDDIDAFVLQIEGKKHWKLYSPRTPEEELPLYSSDNFKEDEIGKPIMEVVLEEGDLLYFPRGTIHQAKAVDGEHSLHITLSAYQLNTYADFLKLHLPLALEQAIEEDVAFRKGLPTDYLNYMGVVHSDNPDKKLIQKRKDFEKKIRKLSEKVLEKPCDLAADQLGKKFVWDSLPPYLTKKEKPLTVHGDGEFLQEGQVFNRSEIEPDTEIKLLRKHCVRLVVEEDSLRLYYNTDNSLEYHGEDAQYVEVDDEVGPAIDFLVSKYPAFIKVEDLPLDDVSGKIGIVTDMWERGLIITKTNLSPFDGEDMLYDPSGEASDSSEDSMEDQLADSDDEDASSNSDISSLGSEQFFDDEEEEEDDDLMDAHDLDDDDEDAGVDDSDEESEEEDYDDPTNFLLPIAEGEEDSEEDDEHGPSFIEEINSDEEDEGNSEELEEDEDSESSDDDEPPPKLTKIKSRKHFK